MRKELPITIPIITCYPQHAFYLSIISNKEDCLPWIFSNYQNLFMDQAGFCDFLVKTPEYYLHPWFYRSQRLHKDFIEKNHIDIISFLEQSIEDDNYIWIHLNEFYLSCSARYKKFDFVHATMLSGYDNVTQKFRINGFYNQQKYSSYWISYEEIKFSFIYAEADLVFKENIHILCYNKEYCLPKFTYNLELFKAQLNSHLNSTFEPFLNPEDFFNLSEINGSTTGLNIYKNIEDLYLSGPNNLAFQYDYRPLYVLYEHKKFLNLKLKYLKNKEIFSLPINVYKKGELLEKEAEKNLTLYLKYDLTKNDNIKKRLIQALKSTKDLESDFLSLILYHL